MTQEEVSEYNKLCAEFLDMEFEIHSNTWRYKDLITTELLFHSDWNWIHEVVEAIKEKTKFKSIDECSEMEWYTTTSLTRLTITTSKEAVVQAIYQFLI